MGKQHLALTDLIVGYMHFAGPPWEGMRRVVVNSMADRVAADGLDGAEVAGDNLRLNPTFLARVHPDLARSYFQPRGVEAFSCHELLRGSPNPFFKPGARPPFDRSMGQKERPALLAYRASNRDLLVSPIGYMMFDEEDGVYWPAASTHAYAGRAVPSESTDVNCPVVIIQDKFEGSNYSHFLFDWVPRLVHFVEARLEDRQRCRFLMGGIPTAFHRRVIASICEIHDLNPEQFFFPSEVATWHCKGVWFFSDLAIDIGHPAHVGHERSLRVIQQISMSQRIEAGTVERLYITRNDTSLRRVSNERVLWTMLRAFGFSMVRLADNDIERQISLFRGSKIIVGPHGMGLTHLVFHQGCPVIIELHNPRIGTDAYAIMSLALGFPYWAVHGAEDDATNGHFHVNVGEVEAILTSLGVKRVVMSETEWDFTELWFPGVQSVPPIRTSAVVPPRPGLRVMRHTRDDAADEPDNNVGWRAVTDLQPGTAYTASWKIWVPSDFEGEVWLHWSDPRNPHLGQADLTMREAWHDLKVGGTASEASIYVVLRVQATAGYSVFSSCWTIEAGALEMFLNA